jgi:ATP-binding cassette subfamily B protein/subfamily B ATP-binding cassette protein MsbA
VSDRIATGSSFRQLRLLRYAGPHWRGLVVLSLAMLVNVALDLLRPWPLKLLIDNVLGHRPVPHVLAVLPAADSPHGLLVWVVMAMIGLFVVGTVVSMTHTYASLRVGQEMTYDLAADLFRHLQRLSLLFHSRRSVGDMIARVTGDSYCVSTFVTDGLMPALQSVILLISMFVVMWTLQPTLTLLALGVVPFLVLVIKFLGRSIKERTRERRDLEGGMMSVVEQTLNAVPAVQAFTREELEHQRFRMHADKTVVAYVRATFAGMWFDLAAGLVTTVGTAAVFYVGADLALKGKLTIGTIIVFVSYLSSLYDPIDSMTHMAPNLQGAAAQADRVMEILETVPDVRDRPHARRASVRGAVRYEDVTFGYEPGRPVLKGISLEARPGDVAAIVGPTGAGKTTLVNLLVRFFDPWSGRVTIGGEDIRDFRVTSLRQQVALVLQEPFIFPLTVAENIAYGKPHARRDEIVAAAVAANADEFIRRLPDGYDAVVGERGATLSGGEKQRLSIARAFLKDAPLLILDEPTSALDARTESLLLDSLERLMQGRITFLIAHRLSTIRNATHLFVLDDGEIVERGTHQELLGLGGLYALLYRQQQMRAVEEAAEPKRLLASAGGEP